MHNALILHYEPVAGKSISAEELSAQLALIRKLKIPVVRLEQLVENNYQRRRWHRHVLLISCTDTFLTQNPTVFQTFNAAGIPVTVFIATSEDPDEDRKKRWQEMAAAGFSLGSNSVSAVHLSQIPETEMQRELTDSKKMIEAATGKTVRFFLPPFGDLNKKIIAAARETGYEALLSGKVGYNRFNADLFRLKTWTVPPHTSLKAFEHMLCRDKKELLVQELKARAHINGSSLRPKSVFGKLKHLFRKVRV